MKILLLCAPLRPVLGNNANLLSKLIPYLKKNNEVHLFSMAQRGEQTDFPEQCFGVRVHWGRPEEIKGMEWLAALLMAKTLDPRGFSDEIQSFAAIHALKRIRAEYPFDTLISTIEPFYMACAALHMRNTKKVLYLMDPTRAVRGEQETVFRNRTLCKLICGHDLILTTPFIKDVLQKRNLLNGNRIKTVGFPMIDKAPAFRTEQRNDGKIELLFCGWLYPDIRSPQFFLKIVSRLDSRFKVVFMGKECEKLRESFAFDTAAEVVLLPQQPYDKALRAMEEADVLINIGNSVPVHMPSKTLEYINTGKPFVNFYKIPDCPTLFYTKRYPLCLNIFEDENRTKEAAEEFIQFCIHNTHARVDRSFILKEFEDCVPRYIAEQILEEMEEKPCLNQNSIPS